MHRVIPLLTAALVIAMPSPAAAGDGSGGGSVDVNGSNGSFKGKAAWTESKKASKKSAPARLARRASASSVSPVAPEPPTDEAEWTYEQNCWAQTRGCLPEEEAAPKADTADANQPDPARLARELVVYLRLPDPGPRFGPDPEVNEWKMAVVGYPLWLWTDGPRELSTHASRDGIDFVLSASWRSTTFDMGDGRSVGCTKTTKYSGSVRPGTRSPTCGYVYARASRPGHDYLVTATTHWTISWAALGQSGSFAGSYAGSRRLVVGELQALVVG